MGISKFSWMFLWFLFGTYFSYSRNTLPLKGGHPVGHWPSKLLPSHPSSPASSCSREDRSQSGTCTCPHSQCLELSWNRLPTLAAARPAQQRSQDQDSSRQTQQPTFSQREIFLTLCAQEPTEYLSWTGLSWELVFHSVTC